MKVLITGSCGGIGKAVSELFLQNGHTVYGLDIRESGIKHSCYRHFVADISDASSLPAIDDVEILINYAGVQDSADDIDVNL